MGATHGSKLFMRWRNPKNIVSSGLTADKSLSDCACLEVCRRLSSVSMSSFRSLNRRQRSGKRGRRSCLRRMVIASTPILGSSSRRALVLQDGWANAVHVSCTGAYIKFFSCTELMGSWPQVVCLFSALTKWTVRKPWRFSPQRTRGSLIFSAAFMNEIDADSRMSWGILNCFYELALLTL